MRGPRVVLMVVSRSGRVVSHERPGFQRWCGLEAADHPTPLTLASASVDSTDTAFEAARKRPRTGSTGNSAIRSGWYTNETERSAPLQLQRQVLGSCSESTPASSMTLRTPARRPTTDATNVPKPAPVSGGRVLTQYPIPGTAHSQPRRR